MGCVYFIGREELVSTLISWQLQVPKDALKKNTFCGLQENHQLLHQHSKLREHDASIVCYD